MKFLQWKHFAKHDLICSKGSVFEYSTSKLFNFEALKLSRLIDFPGSKLKLMSLHNVQPIKWSPFQRKAAVQRLLICYWQMASDL